MIPVLHLRQSSGGGGGADTVILNSAKFLDKSRFSLTIGYLRKHSHSLDEISREFALIGADFVEFPGRSLFDLGQIVKIARLIRQKQITLVHCHDPKADFIGYLLKRIFPSLVLCTTIHGWIKSRKRSAFYVALDKWCIKRFDTVTTVSAHTGETLQAKGMANVVVMRNAIDKDYWTPRKDKGERGASTAAPFTVGFVGRLSQEKGPLDFVRIAYETLHRRRDAQFLVAGEGPDRRHMETLAAHLNIQDKIQFLGHQSKEELFTFYERLDLLLLPSYTEGIPMTVLEALSMGVPVVASQVGGVGEVITHGIDGILVQAGDIEHFVLAVTGIKEDPGLASSLSARGRKTIEERFSFSVRIKEMEALYMRVLHK